MTQPDYATVENLALEYLRGAGVEVNVTDEGLVTRQGGKVFGLEPLRRRMANVQRELWAQTVADHFDVLLAMPEAPPIPATFDEAAPVLRSAVIAEADMGLFDGAIFERHLGEGLGERLMMRHGDVGMTVTAEAALGWDVTPAAIWDAARSHSLWDEPVQTVEMDGYFAIQGGRWTSTQALNIGHHLGSPAPYGALVAIPARDEVLCHRIVDDAFMEVAVRMLGHAAQSYAASPLPMGADLYWWNPDGAKLARIATPHPEQARFRYIRVPEFSAMLWRLQEAIAS